MHEAPSGSSLASEKEDLMPTSIEELRNAEGRLQARLENLSEAIDNTDEEVVDSIWKIMIQELRDICSLIRRSEKEINKDTQPELWSEFILQAQRILDDTVDFACANMDELPQMPSFAHTIDSDLAPVVKSEHLKCIPHNIH